MFSGVTAKFHNVSIASAVFRLYVLIHMNTISRVYSGLTRLSVVSIAKFHHDRLLRVLSGITTEFHSILRWSYNNFDIPRAHKNYRFSIKNKNNLL